MGCGGSVERSAVTCVCSEQTVFEGAVIGQVFTGEVRLQCPLATLSYEVANRRESLDGKRQQVVPMLVVAAMLQVPDALHFVEGVGLSIPSLLMLVCAAAMVATRLRRSCVGSCLHVIARIGFAVTGLLL